MKTSSINNFIFIIQEAIVLKLESIICAPTLVEVESVWISGKQEEVSFLKLRLTTTENKQMYVSFDKFENESITYTYDSFILRDTCGLSWTVKPLFSQSIPDILSRLAK